MFIEAKDDGGDGDNWTTGAIRRAKRALLEQFNACNVQVLVCQLLVACAAVLCL